MNEDLNELLKELQGLILERYRATAMLDELSQEIQDQLKTAECGEYREMVIKSQKRWYEDKKKRLAYDSLDLREKQILKELDAWKSE